jgi:hypothetical protein
VKLPPGITSHIVPGVNGLDMHLFEAGDRETPAIVLLHEYPELAYSWMKMRVRVQDFDRDARKHVPLHVPTCRGVVRIAPIVEIANRQRLAA